MLRANSCSCRSPPEAALATKELYRLIVIYNHRLGEIPIEVTVVLDSKFLAELAMIDVEGSWQINALGFSDCDEALIGAGMIGNHSVRQTADVRIL